VLLTMIMVVAAFSIVSTLVMMIMEKESDIAILKAMGAQDDAIERIFAIEGTLIGLVGTAIGVLAAVSVTARIAWVQRQIELITGIDTDRADHRHRHAAREHLPVLDAARRARRRADRHRRRHGDDPLAGRDAAAEPPGGPPRSRGGAPL
jgi:hypothetical protein